MDDVDFVMSLAVYEPEGEMRLAIHGSIDVFDISFKISVHQNASPLLMYFQVSSHQFLAHLLASESDRTELSFPTQTRWPPRVDGNL